MDDETGMWLHQLMRAHHNACATALVRRGLRDIGSPRLLWELSRYPDDLISITRKGRDAIRSGMEAFQRVDDYMYHGFSPGEREMMSGFLHRMLENLYRIGGDRREESPKDPLGPPPPPPLLPR